MLYTNDVPKDNVLVVILNYKGWEETLSCVDAVLQQTYSSFHILLIENGSGDESLEKLKHFGKHPQITFIEHPKNLGFAGGVNVGIRRAIREKYHYVALLNNDALVTKTWLEELINAQKNTGASVVTGLLLNGDGSKIESTGDSCSIWGLPFPRQRDEPASQAEDSAYVFGGTAGASLYTTALFEDIGLFDETFFAYFEDTDISYRTQLAGHKAFYEKKAIAYHDHGTTSSKIPGFTVYQSFKNLPMFFWKNTPLSMFFSTGVRFYAAYCLMYIRALLRGQFGVATKGALQSVALFPHVLKERWRIQKIRRVPTSYLKSMLYPDLPPSTQAKRRRIFHR